MMDSNLDDDQEEDWSLPVETDQQVANNYQRLCSEERISAKHLNRLVDIRQSELVHVSRLGHSRTILHIDIDCFYAQVEMLRNPELRNKPLGIQQKYLLVTCNYVAREYGVTKLMGIKEAKEKCPNLVMVSGEDLTHYREMSYKISEFLQKYTPNVERLGFDENFLDVSEMVNQRLQNGDIIEEVKGYVYSEDKHETPVISQCTCGCHKRLLIGSHIANDIREALHEELGITCCAGISYNKILAKLVAGQHKPNQQTTLFPEHTNCFMTNLNKARDIPGVGWTTSKKLSSIGVNTIQNLQDIPVSDLAEHLGETMAVNIKQLSYGVDDSPVIPFKRPQTLSDEDSFKKCCTVKDVRSKVKQLLLSLLKRLKDDGRIPHTVRLTIRRFTTTNRYSSRESRQCPLPSHVLSKVDENINQSIEKVEEIVMSLFHKLINVTQPFHLTLINIAFCNLQDRARNSISSFFSPKKLTGNGEDNRTGTKVDDQTGSKVDTCNKAPNYISNQKGGYMSCQTGNDMSSHTASIVISCQKGSDVNSETGSDLSGQMAGIVSSCPKGSDVNSQTGSDLRSQTAGIVSNCQKGSDVNSQAGSDLSSQTAGIMSSCQKGFDVYSQTVSDLNCKRETTVQAEKRRIELPMSGLQKWLEKSKSTISSCTESDSKVDRSDPVLTCKDNSDTIKCFTEINKSPDYVPGQRLKRKNENANIFRENVEKKKKCNEISKTNSAEFVSMETGDISIEMDILPPDIDKDVFSQLPMNVQQEIINDFKSGNDLNSTSGRSANSGNRNYRTSVSLSNIKDVQVSAIEYHDTDSTIVDFTEHVTSRSDNLQRFAPNGTQTTTSLNSVSFFKKFCAKNNTENSEKCFKSNIGICSDRTGQLSTEEDCFIEAGVSSVRSEKDVSEIEDRCTADSSIQICSKSDHYKGDNPLSVKVNNEVLVESQKSLNMSDSINLHNHLDDINIPPNIDREVFVNLPSDIQKEIMEQWKIDQRNQNRHYKEKTKTNTKQNIHSPKNTSILKYFGKTNES